MKRQFKITDRYTPRSTIASNLYISELNKYDLLTTEEEISYAQRARSGDQEAIDKLVKGNLRFVVTVAKRYTSSPTMLEELIQAGNEGLIKAAKRFDETRGFKFISYAVWWIRQEILTYIAKHKRVVYMPPSRSTIAYKLYECEIILTSLTEREPTDKELYEFFVQEHGEQESFKRITFDNFKEIRDADKLPTSFDAELSADDNTTLIDITPSEDDSHRAHELEYTKELIKQYLTALMPRERYVIKNHYGIDCEQKSLQEIADEFNMHPNTIGLIHKKALRKLRSISTTNRIKTELEKI
jgi:RNA polymerase primary sigma factor